MKALITICEGEVCIDFIDVQERYYDMTVKELSEMIDNLRLVGYEVPDPEFIS